MKKFTVQFEEAQEGGYIAQCIEMPEAMSQGETPEEALANLLDAMDELAK